MAKWTHADVQDKGLDELATVDAALLLKSYTAGDSYATVTGGAVKVAETALVGGDFSKSGAAGATRTLTCALSGKSAGNALISTTNGVDNLHVALVHTATSRVLFVTDESTDQSITSGNPVTFSSNATYAVPQPI